MHERLLIGYHGTDRKTADDIVSGRSELQLSNEDYHWLGGGAYFWENDPVRAMEWARERLDGRTGKQAIHDTEPAVIGAFIQPRRCLDLTVRENLDFLRIAYRTLLRDLEAAEEPVPVNREKTKRLDSAVIEHAQRMIVAAKQEPFDVIRAYFGEGTELFPTSGLRTHDHEQICVRSLDCVIGFFHPRAIG